MILHQDNEIDFQKKCLELLKISVKENESSKQNLAYLIDRVKKNEKFPQTYGTQFSFENGKYKLYPVEDIENLDARRQEMGLCPLNEYKEQFKKFYHLTNEDFK